MKIDLKKECDQLDKEIVALRLSLSLVNEQESRNDIFNVMQYKLGRLHAYENILNNNIDEVE